MADREKVKTGIFEMLQRNTWKDIDKERHKFQPVLNDALTLLKEQEPVEPKVEPAIVPTFKVYSCGHCDTIFHLVRQKYCANCGRRVKWKWDD